MVTSWLHYFFFFFVFKQWQFLKVKAMWMNLYNNDQRTLFLHVSCALSIYPTVHLYIYVHNHWNLSISTFIYPLLEVSVCLSMISLYHKEAPLLMKHIANMSVLRPVVGIKNIYLWRQQLRYARRYCILMPSAMYRLHLYLMLNGQIGKFEACIIEVNWWFKWTIFTYRLICNLQIITYSQQIKYKC